MFILSQGYEFVERDPNIGVLWTSLKNPHARVLWTSLKNNYGFILPIMKSQKILFERHEIPIKWFEILSDFALEIPFWNSKIILLLDSQNLGKQLSNALRMKITRSLGSRLIFWNPQLGSKELRIMKSQKFLFERHFALEIPFWNSKIILLLDSQKLALLKPAF